MTRTRLPLSLLAPAATRERHASAYSIGRLGARSEATTGTAATITLYGAVGRWWGDISAKAVAQKLAELGDNVTELTVHLHSGGGDAFEGVAVFNVLRNHKAKVTVVVDGLAASAASVIAMAGDEIVMGPGTQMMIHDAWIWTAGNATDLRAEADWLDKQSANLASVYAWRAGDTAEHWRAAMQAAPDGTWYTADEAVAAKLADRVAGADEVETPTTAPVEEEIEDPFDDEIAAMIAQFREARQVVTPALSAAIPSGPKPPTASAEGSTTTQGTETAVTFTDQQLTTMRAKLELPETADEAAIVAAVEAVVDDSLEQGPANAAGTTPQVPEGMALVSTEVLNELRQGAEDGRAARAAQRIATRDQALAAAISSGRIAPSQREHFASLYDADPNGTQSLLNQLQPGMVPLDELGHDEGGDDVDVDAVFEAAHAALLKQQGINPTKEA